jgi:iron complex outermembrane receptor protein
MKKKLLLFWLLAQGSHSFAQITRDLPAIPVTAKPIQSVLATDGKSVTIIDGKAFEKLPVQTIDEILKYVPGVEVQQRGPFGAQSNIILRGGTFQQVLILLDGMRVNDPLTGHFNSYIAVAPAEIERIEIIRGPSAAIYGPDAVGGVVQVITKTFSKSFENQNVTTGSAQVFRGDYQLSTSNIGANATSKNYIVSAGLTTNTSDGFPSNGIRSYFKTGNGSVGLAFRLPSNWRLNLRSSADHRDFSARNFYTTFASDTAAEVTTQWWNQAKLQHFGKNSRTDIDAVFKYNTDWYRFNPSTVVPNQHVSRLMQVQAYHYMDIKDLSVVFGLQFDNRSLISNDRGNHENNHLGLSGMMKYKGLKWLDATVGLRIDHDDRYGTEVLPQVNLVHNLNTRSKLRASVGRAIRGPEFTEQYNNYNKARVSGGSIGNPDLTAERSWSYEIGIDHTLGAWGQISLTGFQRESQDLIDWVNTPWNKIPRNSNLDSGKIYAFATNQKWVQTRGVELFYSIHKNFTDKLSIDLLSGLTMLESITSDANPSYYILSHANKMVNSNLTINYSCFSVSVNGIWKYRNSSISKSLNTTLPDEYAIWNTRIDWRFSQSASLQLQINNIGDIVFSDLLGSPLPGRWAMAGVNIKF